MAGVVGSRARRPLLGGGGGGGGQGHAHPENFENIGFKWLHLVHF